jgi:hypothetical protein
MIILKDCIAAFSLPIQNVGGEKEMFEEDWEEEEEWEDEEEDFEEEEW